jgi:hypothetical protein
MFALVDVGNLRNMSTIFRNPEIRQLKILTSSMAENTLKIAVVVE